MKIVLLGDSIATQDAGIHFYGRQLVKKITDHYSDHDIFMVLPWHLEEVSSLGITPIIVPLRRSIPFHLRLRQMTSIPRRLRRIAPDIVIELAHFGPFRLPSRTKRITFIHDLTPLQFPQFHPRLSVFMHRRFLPGIIAKADFIFTNSLTTKAAIISHYPQTAERISVIYPTVVAPAAEDRSTTPAPHWPYFLSVGSLEPRKNLQVILEAFEMYCEDHQSSLTQLILVGPEGWKNQQFWNTLKKSPVRERIIISGRISRADLWQLYEGALALISASIAEGFGLPLLEAMSLSVPLIVSDIPVYREVGGDSALFFPIGDAKALCSHLSKITKDDTRLVELRKQSQGQYLKLKSLSTEWPNLA